MQAELIAIAFNSIKDICIELKGVIEIQINDSRLLDALLDYSEIKGNVRTKVLKIFSGMHRLHPKNIKAKLEELGLSTSICEKLENYFKIQGKLSHIKEFLKKQPIFRDEYFRQILNEDLAYLEQCCEYYGIKNVVINFSVIDEDLLYYSGFLCRFIYKEHGRDGKKNRNDTHLLASGGCYNNLIENYTMPEVSKQKTKSEMFGIGVTIYYDIIISLLLQSRAYSWLRGPSVFLSNNIQILGNEIDEISKKKFETIIELWKIGISAIYNYNNLDKDAIDELCRRYKIRFWINFENKNKKKEAERKDSDKKENEKAEEDTKIDCYHDIKISIRDHAFKAKGIEEINRKDLTDILKEKLKKGSVPLTFKAKKVYESSDEECIKY